MWKIKSIQSKVNYKTIYYSLGLLITDSISVFLNEENEEIQLSEIKEENMIIEKLEKSIGKTKLFYFLKRSLNKEIEKRVLLYI